MTPYYSHGGITIYNADCRDVLPTLPSSSIDLTVTSPPYNCRKEYGAANDERPWPEYYADLDMVLDNIYRVTCDGGTIAIVVPGVIRWQSAHTYADTWSDFDRGYNYRKDGEMSVGKGSH